ncbi:amidase [Labrys wisconsinensis]|uniref:Amidase/aspartyl-tRNA(Asn)/glutamyl-tRNA(Gln) amidotransferase subunit A n=1 Tax=Labrys wisconsinensis TaxID=425677 RepID=A0ABU0J625_9HYPH|nr:amidase [Labrys wisconsinensis]MDQ0469700.1 amidase/aspartyl-tRNA(Asn)/glutamyl-tRNA(Gln) amidotransferase subunit A [Labrys wisconsinensis]
MTANLPEPSHPDPLADAPELCRLSASELVAAYARGDLSPVEVAEAALRRAEAIDPGLNAFVAIDADGALAAARASQARWRSGSPSSPVDGVPATIKDIVWVEDWSIRYGSTATDAAPVEADAPAVARLRAAGCVFLGLTTTPEFGWKAVTDSPATGITRNPHDPRLTPGGSSGGAAVAAATGAGVFHLGTDGGGSIRIPAGFSGIVGHKPSFGRVAAYPMSAFGTVAHIGPMARTVADAAAMLAAMSGPDPRDWYQQPGTLPPLEAPAFALAGTRIGYWREPPVGRLDPEVAALVDAAVRRIEGEGAAVEPVRLPGEDLHGLFQTLWFSGAAARLAALGPVEHAGIDPGFRAAAAAGGRFSAVDLTRASQRRAEFGRAMDALLARHAVLVSPAVAVPAFGAGLDVPEGSGLSHWTEWAGFSFPLNLSQQPACVIPAGKTRQGRPVGLQIVGARGQDAQVLAAAAALQALLAS